jgi:hypothetical protein
MHGEQAVAMNTSTLKCPSMWMPHTHTPFTHTHTRTHTHTDNTMANFYLHLPCRHQAEQPALYNRNRGVPALFKPHRPTQDRAITSSEGT